MSNKIDNNNLILTSYNYKTEDNSKNDAKVKSVTTKKQIPDSKKSHKSDKTLSQRLLKGLNPKKIIAKFKNKIPSDKINSQNDKLLRVNQLMQRYNAVDISQEATDIVKKPTQVKVKDTKFNAGIETKDDFSKSLNEILQETTDIFDKELKKPDLSSNKKSEDDKYQQRNNKLNTIKSNQQKVTDHLLLAVDKLDDFYKNFDDISEEIKNPLEKLTELKKQLEELNPISNENFNQYKELKDEFTTVSNNLFKYHNAQMKFEKKYVGTMAIEIKKLKTRIDKSYSDKALNEIVNKLIEEKKSLEKKYKLYKDINSSFKNFNIHNKYLDKELKKSKKDKAIAGYQYRESDKAVNAQKLKDKTFIRKPLKLKKS